MTVEVHTAGPGDESWRSLRYAVTINGTPAFAYGYARSVAYDTRVWNQGDSPEQSWVVFGADETATVVISLVDGSPIQRATVYPGNKGVTETIQDGTLTLTVPAGVKLRVEINDDGAQTLQVCSSALKTSPGSTTDFSVQSASIDPGTDVVTSVGHGLTTDDQVILRDSAGALQAASGDLNWFDPLYAQVIDADTFQVVDTEGASVDFTAAEVGTLSLHRSVWDDTVNTLRFPAGVHYIGRLLRLRENTRVYLDEGAVVIGTFDLRQRDVDWSLTGRAGQGINIEGPGILSGSFMGREDVPEETKYEYVMFQNYGQHPSGGADYKDCELIGVTVLAQPYHVDREGSFWHWKDVKSIAPWYFTADGPNMAGPKSEEDPRLVVEDCLFFLGDDGTKGERQRGTRLIRNCFYQAISNSCISIGYWPKNNTDDRPMVIEDVDFVHVGLPDNGLIRPVFDVEPHVPGAYIGNRTILKALTDGHDGLTPGDTDQTSFGLNNVTIRRANVWGPCKVRPIILGNLRYPYYTSTQRDRHGNLKDWLIEDWVMEFAPESEPMIVAHDSENTPHDITITGMYFGSVLMQEENFRDHWVVDEEVYNLHLDTNPFYEFLQTSQKGGHNMLSKLEAVNTLLATIGSAPVNTITGTVSADVAAAKHTLEETTRKVLLRGWTFNTDSNYSLTPDSDGRIRLPSNVLKVDLDPRESTYTVDPVQRGDYLYNRHDHSYTWNKSLRVEMVVSLPWEHLPESMRRYIEASSARVFASRMGAEKEALRSAEADEMDAMVTIRQHETDTGDFSMLQSPTAADIVRRGI